MTAATEPRATLGRTADDGVPPGTWLCLFYSRCYGAAQIP
jgi:hypothetical protein